MTTEEKIPNLFQQRIEEINATREPMMETKTITLTVDEMDQLVRHLSRAADASERGSQKGAAHDR